MTPCVNRETSAGSARIAQKAVKYAAASGVKNQPVKPDFLLSKNLLRYLSTA